MDNYQFLTICPNPPNFNNPYKHYYFQHVLHLPKIKTALSGYQYELYPELTKHNNIHYHAIVIVDSSKKLYKQRLDYLYNNVGFCKSSEVQCYHVVDGYCKKSATDMEKKLCCKIPI